MYIQTHVNKYVCVSYAPETSQYSLAATVQQHPTYSFSTLD